MNIILQFVMHIYAALLRLYPRAFRDEFAAEMKNVFGEQVAEATAHGRLALTALCLREVRDLPLAILYEHWLGLVEADMDSLIGINNPQILFDDRPSPGSKREAALAALPHLLMTVLILPELLTGLGLVPPITGTWAGNALLFGFALSILAVFILAWRQHFPRWFAS